MKKENKTKPLTAIELIGRNESGFRNQLIRKGSDFDLFLRTAIELIENDDKLSLAMTSEKGQKSIINALKIGATLALPLSPMLGLCCLVPYEGKDGNTTVSYQVEKNGLTLLAKEQSWSIFACTVYENDKLRAKHSIDGDDFDLETSLTNRGKPIGFLSSGKNEQTGAKRFEYMNLEQIVDHAKRFAGSGKVKALFFKINTNKEIMSQVDAILRDNSIDYYIRQSSWLKSFCAMGEKTVIKKLLMRPDFNVITGALLKSIEYENDENEEIEIENAEIVASKIEEEKTEKEKVKKQEVF